MSDINGRTDSDHTNPTYDSTEDGQVDNADKVDGKHAADLGGISLPDLARTDGIYKLFEAGPRGLYNNAVSGSGQIDHYQHRIFLGTGTTSDSYANISKDMFGKPSATWDKDRTASFSIDVNDAQGPINIGTGSMTTAGFSCIGFRFANGDLLGVVDNGSSETTTTLVSGVTTAGMRLEFEFTAGTDAVFYKDGAQVGSISSGLPSGTDNQARAFLEAEVANSTSTQRQMNFYPRSGVVQHP